MVKVDTHEDLLMLLRQEAKSLAETIKECQRVHRQICEHVAVLESLTDVVPARMSPPNPMSDE